MTVTVAGVTVTVAGVTVTDAGMLHRRGYVTPRRVCTSLCTEAGMYVPVHRGGYVPLLSPRRVCATLVTEAVISSLHRGGLSPLHRGGYPLHRGGFLPFLDFPLLSAPFSDQFLSGIRPVLRRIRFIPEGFLRGVFFITFCSFMLSFTPFGRKVGPGREKRAGITGIQQ